MKKFLIIIEETGTGYSAYSPDVPGRVAAGAAALLRASAPSEQQL